MKPKPTLDSRLDAYIAAAAPFAQPLLQHWRRLTHQACPGVVETIKWSFPHFEYHGVLSSMAAFKAHCAFGFWHQGMVAPVAAVMPGGDRSEEAMGHLGRVTSRSDLPPDRVLLALIRQAMALNESGEPARPRTVRATPRLVEIPPVLKEALKSHPAAAANFKKFSPSQQREYTEWIAGAHREETRQKRLASALEWLAAGKSRNWKYERC